MLSTYCLFALFLSFIACAGAVIDCSQISLGRYCTSTTHFEWCYSAGSASAGSDCPAGTSCLCGFVPQSSNPCGIAGSTLPSGCSGSVPFTGGQIPAAANPPPPPPPPPASSGSSGTPNPSSSLPFYSRAPSRAVHCNWLIQHLLQVLAFDPNNFTAQIKELIAQPSYNDASLYTPSTNSLGSNNCSFHPGVNYDANLNQVFIGRPMESTMISYTQDVTVRLPDRYMGMFLVYAMDMFGLNPSMLLGLSSKESFFPVLYLTGNDGSYFLVDNDTAHFDCFATPAEGLCSDGNHDGPFQVETPSMSTDCSIFAQRFYPGSMSVPKAQRTPIYDTDNDIANIPGFRAYHDSLVLDPPKAVVLTSLDFHMRFNILIRLQETGFRDSYSLRTSRAAKEQLLFATAMYTYNRGIYDKAGLDSLLTNCTAEKDPILDCNLNGYGGHSEDIGKICTLIDRSTEVYDFPVTKDDVDWFLGKLEDTYPYDSVALLYPFIDWSVINASAWEAFDILQQARWKNESISYRYDFRVLVAVIRAFLPEKEILLGATLQSLDAFYDTIIEPDLPPVTSSSSFSFDYVATAGSHFQGPTSQAPPNVPNVPSNVPSNIPNVPNVANVPAVPPSASAGSINSPLAVPPSASAGSINSPFSLWRSSPTQNIVIQAPVVAPPTPVSVPIKPPPAVVNPPAPLPVKYSPAVPPNVIVAPSPAVQVPLIAPSPPNNEKSAPLPSPPIVLKYPSPAVPPNINLAPSPPNEVVSSPVPSPPVSLNYPSPARPTDVFVPSPETIPIWPAVLPPSIGGYPIVSRGIPSPPANEDSSVAERVVAEFGLFWVIFGALLYNFG